MKKADVRELLGLLWARDMKGLLSAPTDNPATQLFRYGLVGGGAFVIDFACYCLLGFLGLHYLLAGIAAFLVSFVFNFYASRVFIFKKSAPEKAGAKEFSAVITISVVGLALTELLLYLGTGLLDFDYRASKIIASVIVLFWNYFARKRFVYRTR